jgi:hypothetical protein
MSTELSITQWIFLFFTTSVIVPTGISYRELQGVSFYDLSYPTTTILSRNNNNNNNNDPEVRNSLSHNYFFTGFWACLQLSLTLSGIFTFLFYADKADLRDTVLSIMLIYFASILAIPWVFIMTDPGYYTNIEKKLIKENNKDSELPKQPKKLKITAYLNARFWLRVYSVIILLILVILLGFIFGVSNITSLERGFLIIIYIFCLFGNIFYCVFIWNMRNPFAMKNSQIKSNDA